MAILDGRVPTCAVAIAGLLGMVLTSSQDTAVSADRGTPMSQGETLGFALTWMLPPMDQKPNCPAGMNKNLAQYILDASPPQERARLESKQGERELFRLSRVVGEGEFKGKPICHHPTAMTPLQPPPHKVVQGSAPIPGLDLDGNGSLSRPKGRSCAGVDFADESGRVTVDNQMYRVSGCTTGYAAGGSVEKANEAELMNGAFSVVLEVTGVGDRLNDPEVEVAIYSSPDPTPFSVTGKPLRLASLMVSPEKKYWAKARGRIANGVLTTEPTTITLYTPSNNVKIEQVYYEARVKLTLKPDGTAEGVLGGYREVESFYFNQIALRHHPGYADQGASVGNFVCPSIYRALHEYADGLRNPQTGRCDGISAALVLKAQPAFVFKP